MIDPNVYKTPSFTELGMKKDIQVKAQREERQREAGFDIAEKSWNEAQYLLTGARKNVAQEAWKLYSEAEIAYEKTGSDSDKRKAKELQAQLMFFVGAGATMQKTWNQEYATAQSAEFAGYADSPEQIQQKYSSRINDAAEVKVENGQVMIKEGDNFVPANQSSYFSTEINPNNSFLIPKAVQTGKFVLPGSYLEEIKGVIPSSTSKEEAANKAASEFYRRLKNDPAFRQDIGMHYAISELGIIDGKQGISRENVRDISQRMEDPEYFQSATQSYLKNILSGIDVRFGNTALTSAPSYSDAVTVDGESVDVTFRSIEKVGNIVGVGQDSEGNFFVTKTIGDVQKSMPATDAEIAQIERELGFAIRGRNISANQTPTAPTATTKAPQTTASEEKAASKTVETPSIDMPTPVAEATAQDPLGLGINVGTTEPTTAPTVDDEKLGETKRPDYVQGNALPNWYYGNLLEFEGGVSTDRKDRAFGLNPDAPVVNGKRAHTNKGVQYSMFKSWAESKGFPKSQWERRFLNLTDDEAKQIADGVAQNAGLMNISDPTLRSLFTQNVWGTGKVWAADFKSGRSSDYRSILDWLQQETGLDFQNTNKMTKEEAQAIQRLYDRDPKAFVNNFFDKKIKYFTTLSEYDTYGTGWTRRANDLRARALAAI